MILSAIFIVGEIFTAGFFIMWFGIGAAFAAVAAYFGLSSAWQWGIFAIVSGILFAASRTFADKLTKEQPPGIGADRYIDKEGIVIEEINNLKNLGRIKVEEEEWRAKSDSGTVIPKGETIKVVRADGTRLVVKK